MNPREFSQRDAEVFLEAFSDGDFLDATSWRVGLDPEVVQEWFHLGRQPDASEDLEQFARAVLRTEGEIRAQVIRDIRTGDAGPGLLDYAEKRFNAFRTDSGVEAVQILTSGSEGMTPEQEQEAIRLLLRRPTTNLRRIFNEERESVLSILRDGDDATQERNEEEPDPD